VVDRTDKYIRPRGYYDNKGNLLNVGFDEINGLPAAVATHLVSEATQSNLGHIRLQESFTTAVLENDWTAHSDGIGVRYAKNDLGFVIVEFSCKSGTTITAGTKISEFPVRYRPSINIMFPIFDLTLARYEGIALRIRNTDGNILVPTLPTLVLSENTVYQGTAMFYAG
jgi:hypothetical protein